jgi:hypothetical protein
MKIKHIKIQKNFPFKRFTDSKGGLRFKAEIYEDGGGWYQLKDRYSTIECREDAKIEHWIDDLDNKIAELDRLRDFLKDVHYEFKINGVEK